MRKLLLTLHLWLTLIAGIFIAILGLTGSIMAFESDLDRLFHPSLFDIPPASTAPLPLETLAAAVERRFPGRRVEGFGLPSRPDASHLLFLDSQSTVFVNGYTGAILGTRRGPTILSRIHQLHIRLLAGRPGEAIIAVAGVVTLFLVLSGLVLWWKYKRFTIRWDASLFRLMFDAHNAVGIFAALFLLLLSTTAVAIAFEGPIQSWLYKATGTKPLRSSARSTPRVGAAPIGPDQALRIAAKTEPGAAPLSVYLPADRNDSYFVGMHFPEDRTPGGRTWATIDQYSGKVLVAQSSRTGPLPVRAYLLTRQIHTGDIFGTPSRVVMSMASLLVVLQAFSGVVMWWKRERKKRQ